MVAVLQIQPITARVVRKPRYNNHALANFSVWYANNEAALGEYYLSLPETTQGEYEDFREFVLCQYDAEQVRRTTYGTEGDDAAGFFFAEQCPADSNFR